MTPIVILTQCAPDFHQEGGKEAMEKFEICQGDSLRCANNKLNRMGMF